MIFPTFLKSQAYQNCVFLLQVYHTCERPFQPHYLQQQQQQQQSKKKVTIVEDNNTESSVWCEEANKKRTVYYCTVERGCTDCYPAKTRKKPMAVTDDKNLLWKNNSLLQAWRKKRLTTNTFVEDCYTKPSIVGKVFLTKKFGDIRCTKTSRLSKIEGFGNYEQCKMYAYLETE